MSILRELTSLLSSLQVPVETGTFKGKAPSEYIVLTPLIDAFALHVDDQPEYEVQEARISLFTKHNYIERQKQIGRSLLTNDFTVSARRYVGYEEEAGYHHYAIDVAKEYQVQED